MDVESGVDRAIRVLLVSGSLRGRSTNTAALRTAAGLVIPGVKGVLYEGVRSLPHFNPDYDRDPLPGAVADLRSQIRHADAVVLSTPEYARALPGSFKNLLDWTIGDDHPRSIYQKPVAWVNVSAHGAVKAHKSLRQVLRYATAEIIEEACTEVSVTHAMVDNDGLIADEHVRSHLGSLLETLAAHVRSTDDAAVRATAKGTSPTVEFTSTRPLLPSSMRVARPVIQIPASLRFYVDILGLDQLGGFAGHNGYTGAFVGRAGSDWHIEFTSHESGVPRPSPTDEDLLVFYVSEERLEVAATSLGEAGFGPVGHENPYWADAGALVCRDPDGYLVVLCPHSD